MARRAISTARTDLDRARNLVAIIWFAGALLAVCLVIAQSIFGRFAGYTQEFWGWFTPTIFPTLALIVGVIGGTIFEDDKQQRTVKRFFFRGAVVLSVVYLAVLLLTLLLEPLAGSHDMQYFNLANYWLSPIQGLVVAALAALFNSKKRAEATPEEPAAKPRGKRRG
jgi:cytochrome bd-type quinol oxidase subunit 2